MKYPSFWLVLRRGDCFKITAAESTTREGAIREGYEFQLDSLAAVISTAQGFTEQQMLDLAQVMPPPGSALMRPPEG